MWLREDADAVINIRVSFDGTWQKRGFTSHYGIGVCIDLITGLVIDFKVLSSYCHACALKENARREKTSQRKSTTHGKKSTMTVQRTSLLPVKPWSRNQLSACGGDPKAGISCATLRCFLMETVLHLGRLLD